MAKYTKAPVDPNEPIEMFDGFDAIDPQTGESLKAKMLSMITDILMIRGKLKPKYIVKLLAVPEVLVYYERAFTHKSYDVINNYEFLEFIGDGTVNNCTKWYISRKFNEYDLTAAPQEPLSRLMITIVQNKTLADIANKLGFWTFLRSSMLQRQSDMKDMLEDVFEAFIGATQWVIDQYIGMGAGYAICYNIISSILEEQDMIKKFVERRARGLPAIEYDAVCDSISILKQTMEDAQLNEQHIGRIIPNPDPSVIEMDRETAKLYMIDNRGNRVPKNQKASRVLKQAQYVVGREEVIINGAPYRKVFVEYWLQRGHMTGQTNNLTFEPDQVDPILIGKGSAFDQKKAIFQASTEALATLRRMGLSKPIPQSYICTAGKWQPPMQQPPPVSLPDNVKAIPSNVINWLANMLKELGDGNIVDIGEVLVKKSGKSWKYAWFEKAGRCNATWGIGNITPDKKYEIMSEDFKVECIQGLLKFYPDVDIKKIESYPDVKKARQSIINARRAIRPRWENSGDDAADDEIGIRKEWLDQLIGRHILLASGFIDVFERVQAVQSSSRSK
jgi:dsRNA-specific ribonuclease